MRHITLFSIALFLFGQLAAQAPATNQSTLSIEQIMQGEKFVGYLPEDISWPEDSRAIYFSWNPQGDTLRSTWKISLAEKGVAGESVKVTDEELMAMPSGGSYNKARTKKVYTKNGDLFITDRGGTDRVTASHPVSIDITNTLEYEGSPRFSGDETKVIFEKEDNLYAWDIESGATEQLTDFRKGSERKEKKKTAQEQWLEDDNLAMFGVLAERKAESKTRKNRREALEPKRPKSYYLGDKQLGNLQISPGLQFVTFQLSNVFEIRCSF